MIGSIVVMLTPTVAKVAPTVAVAAPIVAIVTLTVANGYPIPLKGQKYNFLILNIRKSLDLFLLRSY